MDKVLYFNSLFSIYRDLLTKKEQNIFSLYYEENMSLSEIALELDISRSAVGNTIKIVEQKLENYEQKLKLNEKNILLKETLNEPINTTLKEKIEKSLE